MKNRIRLRKRKPNEPLDFKEAYRILYLRYKSNQEKLSRANDRYAKLMADLVRLGYAEYDSDVNPTKVMLKHPKFVEERELRIVPPVRESYDNPSVTYQNVTASFMTRTVFLWFLKRLGLVVVGVTAGYFIINYLGKWQIPI